ncbi:MAG TPA: DUF2652 domain-containing protein [Candidatus Dormibacteraeota bacterium]|nr:DUF2652 domain-containing protein [Candidatus Dormibacteraeota bacterium]
MMAATPQRSTFLIADISGYTSYLAGVELEHAQDILADLLGAIVSSLRPAFRLAKLEGDAVFMHRPGDAIDGTALLDAIERCYIGFRRRRRDVRQATSCPCNACTRIPDLDLKFVVHTGLALERKVAGSRELIGSDVIVVHRLLKNEVVRQLGIRAYALLTQACLDEAGIDPGPLGMRPLVERYDSIGNVPCWVHDLERRWQEEEERVRVLVSPEESIATVSIPTRVPPQVAWEYLTEPGRRMAWQPWVTAVEVRDAAGGRRGPGSSNHCRHGKDAVVEEILDWRPYDYVTDRTVVFTPDGPVGFPHTIELEPTPEGTIIHMRFGWPKTPRERAAAMSIAEPYSEALTAAAPGLVAELDAIAAAGEAGGRQEPPIRSPDPSGVLAGLAPIEMLD